jgi:hypothetical protein
MNFISYNQHLFESTISKVDGVILFTDIVGSSLLWKEREKQMYTSLEKQEDLFASIAKTHKGLIIKTIGDAFMIYFDNVKDAVLFSIDIQKELKRKPIKIGNKKLEIRCGFTYGPLIKKVNDVQNCTVDDFYGNTVNTASRMESKVSDVGGFAFSSLGKFDEKDVKDILDKECTYKIIKFTENAKDIEFKRSGRLLTKSHQYAVKDVDKLKGIKEVEVYSCQLK